MATVQLTTSDGHELTADIAAPAAASRGGVVVCHPHPQHGGDRFNPVVSSAFDAVAAEGFTALRFDFRGEFDHGVGERLDVVAALDALAAIPVAPLIIVGYSFGAAIALTTDDPRVSAIAAIAPPLAMMPAVTPPMVPTLVLTPRHDQFSPPDVTEPIVTAWPTADFEVIESADHFLAGHTIDVATRTVAWLTRTLGARP